MEVNLTRKSEHMFPEWSEIGRKAEQIMVQILQVENEEKGKTFDHLEEKMKVGTVSRQFSDLYYLHPTKLRPTP